MNCRNCGAASFKAQRCEYCGTTDARVTAPKPLAVVKSQFDSLREINSLLDFMAWPSSTAGIVQAIAHANPPTFWERLGDRMGNWLGRHPWMIDLMMAAVGPLAFTDIRPRGRRYR